MAPSLHCVCRWVAPAGRGKALSTIYAASSSGTVLGLMATPILAQLLGGWPACFLLFAGLGIAWAVGLPVLSVCALPVHFAVPSLGAKSVTDRCALLLQLAN